MSLRFGGIVPGALTGIERRAIAAPDDGAIFGEKYPPRAAAARRVRRDDLVGESRVLRGMQRVAQGCAVLAGDMGHHEKFAVVEPDIERQDLRIDPNTRSINDIA